ncbi:hypothetical protein HN51_022157 [Arachis hypogaea]
MVETGSEDDGLLDLSEDDFFLAGSSSDEADADDEWTDKSMSKWVSMSGQIVDASMVKLKQGQRIKLLQEDRFLLSFHFQREKPWMIQLASVTCISLAAKVEETQVPLLLDLQVEDAKYVFEAKTIQRMELLILSTLNWKMHYVTPLSFLDHIIRRLGLKTHLH